MTIIISFGLYLDQFRDNLKFFFIVGNLNTYSFFVSVGMIFNDLLKILSDLFLITFIIVSFIFMHVSVLTTALL